MSLSRTKREFDSPWRYQKIKKICYLNKRYKKEKYLMENAEEQKPKLRSLSMTLKTKKKMKRKNKKTRLQELYNEGKVRSEEFYKELTTFIKWRLMPDLIRRGYYINGVKQNNFSRDEWDSCYTHVLNKILTCYSPEKGTLATYVRWQIRGWGQLVIQKQVRLHKYLPQGTVPLDSNNIYNIKLDEYKNYKLPEDIEKTLDYYLYGDTILDNITMEDLEDIRDGIKDMKVDYDWVNNLLGDGEKK